MSCSRRRNKTPPRRSTGSRGVYRNHKKGIELLSDAQTQDSDAASLATAFEQLPKLLAADPDLVRRGAFFDARFQVGIGAIPFDIKVEAGSITGFERGPFLMRPWHFAIRGTSEAWSRLWRPIPGPGWHDLLALTKKGCVTIEGDLQPLMANLQYMKDLLVLPRNLNVGC
jgi:hypothetical protein